MKKTGIIVVALAVLPSLAAAADGPSVGRGKELFESAGLGTSGKSCVGCHPGGKGVERALVRDDEELGEIVNQCITKPLRGKALDPASTEMKSLIMYIRSFAGRGKR